ncbi:YkvA family protein [Marinimicrococcus flavescens]|uniref:YkvA family protein n=1 Tax=Marinimicrococcus flavescens TaxID=3031815 RepID=A0AAP3V1I4_9PROT|nr:YkvA family protein [Marinimicrococcus flavescens]
MVELLHRYRLIGAEPKEAQLWRKLGRIAARLPFAHDLVAAWYCARDPATPGYVRAVLLGAVAYFIMPMDAVPDIVAVLGFTDDAAVIAAVLGALGTHVTEEHRAAARDRLASLET